MKVTYDPNSEMIYIRLSETPDVDFENVAPGITLFKDKAGNVVAIEIDGEDVAVDNPSFMEWLAYPLYPDDVPIMTE